MYVLDAVAPVAAGAKRSVSLGVGPIAFPKRLDRPQIVTRIAEHKVKLAEFDHWAEPLERSFARAVAENLARSIPTDRVAVYPWTRVGDVDWKIEIDVSRFEREVDGSVTLAARWRVIGSGDRRARYYGAADFRETPADSTMAAMVETMSEMVGSLSERIAASLPEAARDASG